jgi:hypothetical protein
MKSCETVRKMRTEAEESVALEPVTKQHLVKTQQTERS